MISHFTSQQLLPLYPALLFLVFAIFAFERQKINLSLGLLFVGTLSLGCFMALLDPFIILWDEQYHALVAKNMMHNPLKPLLFANPVMGYDYRDWTNNHIWLHKQPLFLWQIALSIKLFGTTAFAVRLPSVIMHAILPLMIYRIGKITAGQKTGFYAAVFFAAAYFPLELTAARYSTDHNDIAFLFYITASLWSWFEYQHTKKIHWVILTGIFSGCAILVKWLVGLLVFLPWGLSIVSDASKRWSVQSYKHFFLALLICLLLFLPWQIFIFLQYPKEAWYEFSMNNLHLHTAVEDHSGSIWFHFLNLRTIYGQGQAVPFILLTGLILLFFKVKNRVHRIGLLIPISAVYLFYSVVATKMLSFCIIVAPLVFLGMAVMLTAFIDFINSKVARKALISVISVVLVMTVAWFNLDLRRIQGYHTMWKPHDNCNRQAELYEMQGIKALQRALSDGPYVVFNASMRVNGQIPVMFFTRHTAYPYIPTKEQAEDLKTKGIKIAIFNIGTLPDYLVNDDKILKINI
ncbi:MAG: ArnT family glycosyltransferase [Bacteroidales bacterium]